MITEKEAIDKAAALCKRLGPEWEPHVWHNLWWCYTASSRGVSVYESKESDRSYWHACYTPNSIVVGESDKSPQSAVLDLQARYKKCYESRKAHWEALSKVEVTL